MRAIQLDFWAWRLLKLSVGRICCLALHSGPVVSTVEKFGVRGLDSQSALGPRERKMSGGAPHTAWVVASIGASAGAILLLGLDRFIPGLSIGWSQSICEGEVTGKQFAKLAKAVSRIQLMETKVEGERVIGKVT